MSRFYQSTHSLFIQAPPERVFEALTDWAGRTRWRPGIEASWEGEGRAYPGQKVTFRAKGFPFDHVFSFRVTGLEPPRRLYMEYTGRPLKGRAAVEITPGPGGCGAAFHWMKVEPEGLPARAYFALGLGMRTHCQRTLETLRMLKKNLENQSPTRSH